MGFLLFFLLAAPAIAETATQSQNLTALRTQYAPPWVSESDSRGTWSLLYSCVFTLAVCVYTAIHLNIPAPEEHAAKQTLRRAKWVFAAVFVPEMGVLTAWQQWCWARKISTGLNKLKFDHDKSSSEPANQAEPPNDPYVEPHKKASKCFTSSTISLTMILTARYRKQSCS